MTECITCENILNGKGGIKCMLLTYRKYIIGAIIGGLVVYVGCKMRSHRK